MYSKLFYLFLVGLISQSIAAPNSLDEFAVHETIRDDFYLTHMLPYLEKCVQRDSSKSFDVKLLQSQIDESFDVDNVLSLDEIAERVETMYDNLIDGLDKDNLTEIVKQANQDLKFVVMSGKESDLHKIVKIVAKSSKKFMGVLMTREKDFKEIHSFNYEFMKAVILKKDPELFKYLLNFLKDIMGLLNRYKESDECHEVVGALRSTLEQTGREINNLQISSDDKIFKSLVTAIHRLSDEIPSIFGMNTSDDYKFRAARCMTEYTVGTMLTQTFIIQFRSAIDS